MGFKLSEREKKKVKVNRLRLVFQQSLFSLNVCLLALSLSEKAKKIEKLVQRMKTQLADKTFGICVCLQLKVKKMQQKLTLASKLKVAHLSFGFTKRGATALMKD